jgi:hypothetical protein
MHTQFELEHYYSHGTWPSEQQVRQNDALHYRCVGICCEQLTSSQQSTGIEATEVRPLTTVSIASQEELADYFLRATTVRFNSGYLAELIDKITSTSTKQPNN